jgi:hypothetical protein
MVASESVPKPPRVEMQRQRSEIWGRERTIFPSTSSHDRSLSSPVDSLKLRVNRLISTMDDMAVAESHAKSAHEEAVKNPTPGTLANLISKVTAVAQAAQRVSGGIVRVVIFGAEKGN